MLTQLERLQVLLGLTDEEAAEKEILLQFVLDEAAGFICHYCRIAQVPQELEQVLVAMAAVSYRGQGWGKPLDFDGVKSLTEGKVSMTFADGSQMAKVQREWFAVYEPQLNRFRKAGWNHADQ